MSRPFHFGRFVIQQSRSLFKVTSDATLFACWIEPPALVGTLADLGAGSGVLSCILKDRFQHLIPYCIEIDANSAADCIENLSSFQVSPSHVAIQDYHNPWPYNWPKKYSMVVANPPFFHNDLRNSDPNLARTRHVNRDELQKFYSLCGQRLHDYGILYVMIPTRYSAEHEASAKGHGFYLTRKAIVRTKPRKNPRITLLAFCYSEPTCLVKEEEITIFTEEGAFTPSYKALVQDCYSEYYFCRQAQFLSGFNC